MMTSNITHDELEEALEGLPPRHQLTVNDLRDIELGQYDKDQAIETLLINLEQAIRNYNDRLEERIE